MIEHINESMLSRAKDSTMEMFSLIALTTKNSIMNWLVAHGINKR